MFTCNKLFSFTIIVLCLSKYNCNPNTPPPGAEVQCHFYGGKMQQQTNYWANSQNQNQIHSPLHKISKLVIFKRFELNSKENRLESFEFTSFVSAVYIYCFYLVDIQIFIGIQGSSQFTTRRRLSNMSRISYFSNL